MLRFLLGGLALMIVSTVCLKKKVALKKWLKGLFELIWRKSEPPEPEPESLKEIPLVTATPAVLITCYEQDQPLLLQALPFGGDTAQTQTAYNTVVVHRPLNSKKAVYLLPPLLGEEHTADLTWGLLQGNSESPDIAFDTGEKTETLALPTAHQRLVGAEVYIGINLAVVPLSEGHREQIRHALLQLREMFGEKLHVQLLESQALAEWPSRTRATRQAIWKRIFEGIEGHIDNPGEL